MVESGELQAQCLGCRASKGSQQDYVMVAYPRDPKTSRLWIYCKDLRAHRKGVPCAFTNGSVIFLSPAELAEALRQAAEAARAP